MTMEVLFCTVPDPERGALLARQLVEERLAACVNIVPGLRSIYRWEGKLCDEPEALLIIKTSAARVDALLQRLPGLHPYAVPEAIAWSIGAGLAPYLAWIESATRP